MPEATKRVKRQEGVLDRPALVRGYAKLACTWQVPAMGEVIRAERRCRLDGAVRVRA